MSGRMSRQKGGYKPLARLFLYGAVIPYGGYKPLARLFLYGAVILWNPKGPDK